jgi:hypothetical protein
MIPHVNGGFCYKRIVVFRLILGTLRLKGRSLWLEEGFPAAGCQLIGKIKTVGSFKSFPRGQAQEFEHSHILLERRVWRSQ